MRRGGRRWESATRTGRSADLAHAALYALCLLSPWGALALPAPAGPLASVVLAVVLTTFWCWWTAPRWGRNAGPLAFARSLILLVSALFAALGALDARG